MELEACNDHGMPFRAGYQAPTGYLQHLHHATLVVAGKDPTVGAEVERPEPAPRLPQPQHGSPCRHLPPAQPEVRAAERQLPLA